MPNISSVFKSEVSRIARKETRADTEALKKASAQYRSDIAALKRRLAALESQLKKQVRTIKAVTPTPIEDSGQAEGLRFRAKGFAAHRQRLGLSAAQAGALLAVSGLTIYHWEGGRAKPRASHMPRIAAFRKLGKKQAAAAVAQAMGT